MQLARFSRRRYTPSFTPMERAQNLSAALGGPEIWIKRDDLLGLAAGGNKTRKLEFLVADALAQGCDTLITVGAPQSNHCRLTLAAANKEGLKCRLVLEQRVPGSYKSDASGNNFLYNLLGVEAITVMNAGDDLNGEMQKIAGELEAKGRKGYIIPGGGSNALGALGYVACAHEIAAQSFEQGVSFDAVVVASGSCGTHSGLLVGAKNVNFDAPITGINVRRPRAEQELNLLKLAVETARLLDIEAPTASDITALDEWVGPGYSLPTDEMVEAVRMTARTESVLLDPVYSGKAMAGLIGLTRRGYFKHGQRILFLHTGGSPALYAYQDVLRQA
jgi:D-cysteine desulfhydrase